MRAKAERLSRSAALYERGAEGERVTAAVLEELPNEEWTVFHDLRWPGRRYANVDHVVVGPPGVFVIDTKNWSGHIKVQADVLKQNGRRRDQAAAGAAEAALAVAQLTSVVSPQHVRPVLCFVTSEQLTGHARDVMVCSTANVLTMLTTRPRAFSQDTLRRLCLDLDISFHPAVEADDRGPRSRPVTSPRSRSTARRPRQHRRPGPRARRRGRQIARFTGFVATMSVMFAMLTTDLPDHIAALLVTVVSSSTDSEEPVPGTDGKDKRKKGLQNDAPRWPRHKSDRR
jgi:hypothetical protein